MYLISCGTDQSFETESGLKVRYITRSEGEPTQADSILMVFMKQRDHKGNTLHHSYPTKPLILRFSKEENAGHLWEVISSMNVGDSVAFETTAQNLFEKTYKLKVPDSIPPTSSIAIDLKVMRQFSDIGFAKYNVLSDLNAGIRANENNAATLQEKLISDGDSIDNYLMLNNIEATTTASGLRYVIKKQGQGEKIKSGDTVVVQYIGRLLSGEIFDSSYERKEAFQLTVGNGEVIKGWDEGLGHLNKGTEATLYIPSPLAYGSRKPNPSIPAYAIMVFDIEVVDVKMK